MPKKVLIVDDDPAIAETLKILMGVRGFETAALDDGAPVLETARSLQPDLILLDMLLPHVDGPEVYRQLQNDPATRHIPVLFLSSFSERPTSTPDTDGIDIPPDQYLAKPIDPGLLFEKIAKIMQSG